MRFKGWFFLLLGAGFLLAAGIPGIRAIQQATEISAYHRARACPAGAPPDADCLQAVDGVVTAVTDVPGRRRESPEYELGVRTTSTTMHLRFGSYSLMLGYAIDGDPAIVTMWRGTPVSVVTDGRCEPTTSGPETALALDLADSETAGGLGVGLVVGALVIRRKRRAGGAAPPLARPVRTAVLVLALLPVPGIGAPAMRPALAMAGLIGVLSAGALALAGCSPGLTAQHIVFRSSEEYQAGPVHTRETTDLVIQFWNLTGTPVRLVRLSLAGDKPAVRLIGTAIYNADRTGGFPAEQIGDLPQECPRSYVPSPVSSLTVRPHQLSHWFAVVAIRVLKPGVYHIRNIRIDYSTPSGSGWQNWNTHMTLTVSNPPLPGPDKLPVGTSC